MVIEGGVWEELIVKKVSRNILIIEGGTEVFSQESRVVIQDKMATRNGLSVFSYRQPIPVRFMESRVLTGREGAFRQKVIEEGFNMENEVVVGLAMQQDTLGDNQGCRVLKVGRVAPKDLNSRDLWPDSPEAKVQIPPFCVSRFGDYNGMMVTPYADIGVKIKMKEGENWKVIKEGERENLGFEGVSMRMFFVPASSEGGDYYILAVPVTLNRVASLQGQPISRAFPGIKIAKGKFKFASPEASEQRFGLGIQPWFIIADLVEEEEGGQDLTGVNWLPSMDVKKTVAETLGGATVPNWHSKGARWKEAVAKKQFAKVAPSETWPEPRGETDDSSEGEQLVSDDDGEFEIEILMRLA